MPARGAYDRYMGRYSDQLAVTFLSFVGGEPGQRALDVGCGPGALTEVLATGLGGAARRRRRPVGVVRRGLLSACARMPTYAGRPPPTCPGIDADVRPRRLAARAQLPARRGGRRRRDAPRHPARRHDRGVHVGLRRRHDDAAYVLGRRPRRRSERHRTRRGPCGSRPSASSPSCGRTAGLTDIRTRSLEVSATYVDFDDYWLPFTLGIGPGGAYAASLDADRLDAAAGRLLPSASGRPRGSFTLSARAVAVSGSAPA